MVVVSVVAPPGKNVLKKDLKKQDSRNRASQLVEYGGVETAGTTPRIAVGGVVGGGDCRNTAQ